MIGEQYIVEAVPDDLAATGRSFALIKIMIQKEAPC